MGVEDLSEFKAPQKDPLHTMVCFGGLGVFFLSLSLLSSSSFFFFEKCFKSRFVIYIKELLSSSDAPDRRKMPGMSGNEDLS